MRFCSRGAGISRRRGTRAVADGGGPRARAVHGGRGAHRDDRLRLLPDVDPLVASVRLFILEARQSLEIARVPSQLAHAVLRAVRDEVLHHRQRLVDVAPLLVA
eukprot:11036-Pelagococcus_subviridis.AAC.1